MREKDNITNKEYTTKKKTKFSNPTILSFAAGNIAQIVMDIQNPKELTIQIAVEVVVFSAPYIKKAISKTISKDKMNEIDRVKNEKASGEFGDEKMCCG